MVVSDQVPVNGLLSKVSPDTLGKVLDFRYKNYRPGLLAESEYWKRLYNTSLGDGTNNDYITSQGYDIEAPPHVRAAIDILENEKGYGSNGLMDRTIKHESHYGRLLGEGKSGGVAQVDKDTLEDLQRELKPAVKAKIRKTWGLDFDSIEHEHLDNNPFLSALVGRMQYARFIEGLPEHTREADAKALPNAFSQDMYEYGQRALGLIGLGKNGNGLLK